MVCAGTSSGATNGSSGDPEAGASDPEAGPSSSGLALEPFGGAEAGLSPENSAGSAGKMFCQRAKRKGML